MGRLSNVNSVYCVKCSNTYFSNHSNLYRRLNYLLFYNC